MSPGQAEPPEASSQSAPDPLAEPTAPTEPGEPLLAASVAEGSALPRPPRIISSFIGREREAAEVEAFLREGRALVTLTGTGGVGKTRVAVEVARHLEAKPAERFRGGVAFVALQAVRDADLVAPTIARAFGLREEPDRAALELIVDQLRAKALLLVLDNFEQVLEATEPVVKTLLEECRDLAVLVTSRRALRLSGEQLYPIQPLGLPAAVESVDAVAEIAAVETSEAGRLFLARARERNPHFGLTERNAAAVAAICRRLDGLPLAIELAAAKLDPLSLRELLGELERRLAFLDEAPRDAPARHQTISAALRWSYDLLPEREQAIFRRLGVFVGGWTIEAAVAVAGEPNDDRRGVIDLLAALRTQHLIQQDEAADGTSRFVMLETTREFAFELLIVQRELEAARAAHARYFLTLAQKAESGLTGPEHATWSARLDADLDNLRAALDWTLNFSESELDSGLLLAASLWRFWDRRGLRREATRWLRTAVDRSNQVVTASRASAFRALGNAVNDTDSREAQGYYRKGLELARIVGDSRLTASLLHGVSITMRDQGDYLGAMTALDEATALFRDLGDRRGLGHSLINTSRVARDGGWPELADSAALEALAVLRDLSDLESTIAVYLELGRNSGYSGKLDDAMRWFEQALEIALSVGELEWAGYAKTELGGIALQQGRWADAVSYLGDALEIFQETETEYGMARSLEGFAAVAASLKQVERAVKMWAAVDRWQARSGYRATPAERKWLARLQDDIRQSLDGDAWFTHWTEGERLGLVGARHIAQDIVVESLLSISRAGDTPLEAAAHSCPLTKRELDVLRRIEQGMSSKEIAFEMKNAIGTVNKHIEHIYEKLEVNNRVQAVGIARRHGWI